jgi:predicted NACHT family NTPase
LQTGQRLRLLSQVGAVTFAEEAYFFKQARVEELIGEFLQSLPESQKGEIPGAGHDEGVLKAIESHHGLLVERARRIYSFSHLTFQEYFAARHLIASRDGLEHLADHASDPRWREVLLLALALLKDGRFLIRVIKRNIDQLIADDLDLQTFLKWLERKSSDIGATYQQAAIRSVYFTRNFILAYSLDATLNPDFNLDLSFSLDFALDRALDLSLNPDLAVALNLDHPHEHALARALDIDDALHDALVRVRDPEFKAELAQLRSKLPTESKANDFLKWWCVNGQGWRDELREVMIKYRNIGHDWQFTDEQKQKLKHHCDANEFLVELINTESAVSPEARQEIEDNLLLPIAELKRRLPEQYSGIEES